MRGFSLIYVCIDNPNGGNSLTLKNTHKYSIVTYSPPRYCVRLFNAEIGISLKDLHFVSVNSVCFVGS